MFIELRWGSIRGLERFSEAIRALGNDESRKVLNRAINRTGDSAKGKVNTALAKQTGLRKSIIVRAVRVRRSGWERLEYRIESSGGDVSLKYFEPRETDAGVSAKPFGQRAVFAQTFLSGGAWPEGRTKLIAGGHAFYRSSGSRLPIERSKSGVVIPAEMVKGATADAFTGAVANVLPRRIAHEIGRITKGVVT
ncbi:hypothetical protein [Aureimonas pseudogalii]|uniref:Phage tail protein n=1 Tax=Aureimonas pseudogalii TaxID=1744844 RepID=A0A7W6E8V3_9HYPH|nr:hypothetical protein [Aureimonas pseudogalii]MBB3996892.1 hypothetical protein [Aureimonas pseudogalii]